VGRRRHFLGAVRNRRSATGVCQGRKWQRGRGAGDDVRRLGRREPDTLARTLGYHALSGWLIPAVCDRTGIRRARPPRLETVLDVALRRYGSRADPVLDDVRRAPPNWNHHFFAAHLAAGGIHITANFDSCIENAYAEATGDPLPNARIEHFHGSLSGTSTVADLGATLHRIEGGFTDDYADHLVGLVTSAPVAVLVGNSGSGFFNVDTAFGGSVPGGWPAGR
jgi:hypothetical protein